MHIEKKLVYTLVKRIWIGDYFDKCTIEEVREKLAELEKENYASLLRFAVRGSGNQLWIDVNSERAETAEELAVRLQKMTRSKELKEIKHRKKHAVEYAEYERLKAKFEKDNS